VLQITYEISNYLASKACPTPAPSTAVSIACTAVAPLAAALAGSAGAKGALKCGAWYWHWCRSGPPPACPGPAPSAAVVTTGAAVAPLAAAQARAASTRAAGDGATKGSGVDRGIDRSAIATSDPDVSTCRWRQRQECGPIRECNSADAKVLPCF
jgi:hypothetical protein